MQHIVQEPGPRDHHPWRVWLEVASEGSFWQLWLRRYGKDTLVGEYADRETACARFWGALDFLKAQDELTA